MEGDGFHRRSTSVLLRDKRMYLENSVGTKVPQERRTGRQVRYEGKRYSFVGSGNWQITETPVAKRGLGYHSKCEGTQGHRRRLIHFSLASVDQESRNESHIVWINAYDGGRSAERGGHL